MTTIPGADELRIRHILRTRGVGPDATPTRTPDWLDRLYEDEPAPTPAAPRLPDWRKGEHADLTKPENEPDADDAADEEEEPEDDAPTKRWPWPRRRPAPDAEHDVEEAGQEDEEPELTTAPPKARKPPKRLNPGAPRAAWDSRPEDPRQSLLDAYSRIPTRIKWLGYHAAAAGAGWRLGWVDWSTNTAAWFATGHWTSTSAWVLYALATCTIALYWRTRGWLWLAAWCAAIPVSSIVVGVLLYGTGYHH